MEFDRFEIKESGPCVHVFVNGSEIKSVSFYSIEQSEYGIAKITLEFMADSVNVQFDWKDMMNANAEPGAE